MKNVIGGIVVGLLLLGIWASNNQTVTDINTEQMVKADRKVYSSLKELKNDSEVVIIGSVEKQLKTYNLAKDATDPTKENPDFVILGTDYLVNVEKYLKGSGEKQIIMTQEGGELNGKKQRIEGRTPIKLGDKYVFFLKKNPDNKYMFGGDPFKFSLSNGKVKVDSDNTKFEEKFPEKSDQEFLAELNN